MIMKGLVAHINSQHIVSRRGSEEYPCFWKVKQITWTFLSMSIYTWQTRLGHIINKLYIFRTAVVLISHLMPSTSWSLTSGIRKRTAFIILIHLSILKNMSPYQCYHPVPRVYTWEHLFYLIKPLHPPQNIITLSMSWILSPYQCYHPGFTQESGHSDVSRAAAAGALRGWRTSRYTTGRLL